MGKPNLAVIVQHHPSRAHLLPALLDRLPADALVVTDPDPDGLPNPWRCYQACLQAIPEGVSHVLIVQDDAVPHPDFKTVLPQCIAARPDRIICYFVASHPVQGARRMIAAAGAREPWAELLSTEFLPVVATSYPVEMAQGFLAWSDRKIAAHRRSDDGNAGRWIREQSIRPLATVPSLVQHPDVELSLIGKQALAGKNPARVAILAPDDRDILSIDWAR